MPRTLALSPVLALFLAGCDLGSLVPDTADDAPAPSEEAAPPAAEDEPAEEEQEAVGCCTLTVAVPSSVVAGERVEVGITLRDDDGADRSGEAVASLEVTGPDGAVSTDGMSFQPMTAGAYTVRVAAEAMGETVEEQAELVVEVGEATAIRVQLSADSVDPGDEVAVTVEGWDVGGNAVEALDAALSVQPEGCAAVDGLRLTAQVDGDCTVTAAVGDLSESARFLVDGNGPVIRLEAPGRGAFVSSGRVTLAGSAWDDASGVAALTVDGEPVADPGAFSTSVVLSPGAHTVTVAAVDHDGNTADLIAGLIAGDFLADGEAFGSIQISHSAASVGELGEALDLSVEDIADAVLTGEPFYDSTDGCSGMTITATGVSVGSVSGGVTPVEGAIEVTVAVSDLVIDLEAEVWTEIRGECYTTTSPDQIVVEETEVVISVSLSAEDGTVEVTVVESGALMSGVDEGMAAEHGVDVAEIIEEALVAALEAAVPEALSEAFADLTLSTSLDVMGAAVALDAAVSDVAVSADGVTLSMAGTAECASSTLEAPGSLSVSSPAAAVSGDSAGLSVDLLNRLLHLGWRSGGLSQHIPHEQLGLEPGIIGLLFPGAETLSLTLEPQLPPVALDAGAGEPLSLSVPEVQVEAWGEVGGEEVLLGRVALHLSGAATPTIRRGVLSLDLEIGDMVADSMDPEAGDVAAAEGLEDMLSLFAGSLGSELFSDVSLELPEALGSPTAVQTDGGGWLILSAE